MMAIDLGRAPTASFEPTAAHELMRSFAGQWEGPTQLWLEPGSAPEESTTELCAESVLGGRWLRLSYRGMAFGKPHAGEMLVGFHKDAREYEVAWIDSSHTGSAIMLSTGVAREDGVVDVLGSYAAAEQRWGWRTRLRRPEPNTLSLEAFNIAPDGAEYRAIASLLSRVG
jgi:hypothetical protein